MYKVRKRIILFIGPQNKSQIKSMINCVTKYSEVQSIDSAQTTGQFTQK